MKIDQVKVALAEAAQSMAAARREIEQSRARISACISKLNTMIPTDVADTITAYKGTGAFETLAKDEMAQLVAARTELLAECHAIKDEIDAQSTRSEEP
jgi:hypothetical protein